MSEGLDADFLSSVHSLSKELQILGVNDNILTTSQDVACQSLLGTAWMLVQFIHCNSVTTAESTLHNEQELKLRDELQSIQTQLQRVKDKLKDKENQMKSVELTNLKLKANLQKWQNIGESLTGKVKEMESKIERCHRFYKNELSSVAADCEKLRDRLRSKLGIARKVSASGDCLSVGIDRISFQQKREENKLKAVQETVVSLKMDNQILVEENLLMRDTFARLHRQLDFVRKYGANVLETLVIEDQDSESVSCDFSHSLFNLPISVAMDKLRSLGELQTEEIIKIFRLIEKTISQQNSDLFQMVKYMQIK